jgi:hypothetical protein
MRDASVNIYNAGDLTIPVDRILTGLLHFKDSFGEIVGLISGPYQQVSASADAPYNAAKRSGKIP